MRWYVALEASQATAFYDIVLHFVAFYDIVLHFVAFYDIVLHFVAFYDIVLHFVAFYDIVLHFLPSMTWCCSLLPLLCVRDSFVVFCGNTLLWIISFLYCVALLICSCTALYTLVNLLCILLQPCVINLVTFVLHIMTVSDLLEQPCNKSDNAIKLVTNC